MKGMPESESLLPNDGEADKDSAWKEMLEVFFPAFLHYFFPSVHADIDWSRGYESLDKELAQIRPSHRSGKLLADKLFKVYLLDGRETWLLVHVEVQDRVNRQFSKRIYTYNYRLSDKFQVEIVSIAVITGSGGKSAGHYESSRWGCELSFKFPVVRIADYKHRVGELEASREVFALVVLAQLKAMETKGDNQRRLDWKRRLIFSMYKRGYSRQTITELFRFLDWIMILPEGLDEQLQQEVYDYEERKRMPYVTSFERINIKRGLEQGFLQGKRESVVRVLQRRFGALSERMMAQISRLSVEQLNALLDDLLDFNSKTDVTVWLKKQRRGA